MSGLKRMEKRANDSQPGLFERPTIPHNRTETSIEAARSQRPTVNAKREQVFAFIDRRGTHGATCDEVEIHLGLRHTTASARINELARPPLMLIVDSGLRRKTSAGRNAIVWIRSHNG